MKASKHTYRWQVKTPWSERMAFARQLRIPELVAQLLYNRGVVEVDSAKAFLQPSLQHLHDPLTLPGAREAAERIAQAVRQQERIVLYGDYDVDGITGVAILWRCLKLAGVEADFYVPHRLDEGYGLNDQAVRSLAEQGTDLLITVDCGATGGEAISLARELGMDVIVTDHHQLAEPLPPANVIVHPQRSVDQGGAPYPNPSLCGAGVAFKLAWVLAQSFSGAKKVSPAFREYLLTATSLAALGTVADVVPLVGENRTLVHYGLASMSASTDPALQAIIEASGLSGEPLSSIHIGFRIAPRLNAAGRMGHARLAMELFTRSTPTRAREIARYLESQNQQRQKVEKAIAEQAVQQVKSLKMDSDQHRGIVLAGEDWHGGVIGIVASRIVDRFHKPAIVISLQPDGRALGSCRSIPGVDIHQALTACAEHLVEFGGHPMAAGVTLLPRNIAAFRAAFNEALAEQGADESPAPVLTIDAEVPLAQLTVPAVQTLDRMEPFGSGNPQPLLLARSLRLICPPRRMGKRADHLELMLTDQPEDVPLQPGQAFRVVAFGKAEWEKTILKKTDRVDLVFEPRINHFNGNTTVELHARDMKASATPEDAESEG